MNKIALVGGAYSGKTTIARGLEKRGYLLVNFTDNLKSLAVEALRTVYPEMEVEDILRNKAYYRPFLQAFGTVIGYDYDPVFVHKALEGASFTVKPVVFDNVRTPEQWSVLQDLGFELVYIQVSDRVRRLRSERLGVSYGEYVKAVHDPIEDTTWALNYAHIIDGTLDIQKIIESLTEKATV